MYLWHHAPYYVNLGSQKPQTVINSKNEIIKAFKLANLIGASRIIFHPGGGHGKTAEDRAAGIEQIIKSFVNLIYKNRRLRTGLINNW